MPTPTPLEHPLARLLTDVSTCLLGGALEGWTWTPNASSLGPWPPELTPEVLASLSTSNGQRRSRLRGDCRDLLRTVPPPRMS